MAISVTCPGCRTSYPVTEDLLGKTIRCKKCQETFTAKAARSAAVVGRGDDRIQKAPAAIVVDDDEFEPRNGPPRPAAVQPKNNNALIVAGSIGGVTILGLAAALIWVLNRDPDVPVNPNPTPTPLVFNNPTPTPPVATNANPADVKPLEAKSPETKITETKPADTKPTTAQLTTSAEIFGGVRMPRPANFNREAVEKAKKSAVIIYCVFEQGAGYGSGWVAEKNGNERYIITNSHVVGMKEREKPPPDKIEITFDSGLPTARTFEGKLLALDRTEDLAVIRVKGPDLPEPLKIAPSFDLVETQKLLILGFPFGGMLKDLLRAGLGVDVTTSLKARESTVTGRMYNKESGSVKLIEVEGGADPGNSGGAVIDTNGNVSAILVAGNPQSNQRWVIPSEYAMHLLAGRMIKVFPGQAIRSGASLKQPIHTLVADPLKRIRSVSVDVWAGLPIKSGIKIRSASATPPQPVEGDGPHVTATLSYSPEEQVKIGEAHTADGELTLPVLQEGQVYWFRPHYIARDGKERWGEAVTIEMGRYPVDPKSAMIAIKHKADLKLDEVRKVELTSKQYQGVEIVGFGGTGTNETFLRANLTERTRLVEQNGDARVRLQYTDLHMGDDERDTAFRKQLRGVMESVKNLGAEVIITKEGRFRSPKADFAQVPQGSRATLDRFNSQIIESLEALSLSVPNKEMAPGETWPIETASTMPVTLQAGQSRFENALFRTTCKFIGTRVRNDREEAVVELIGTVVRNENAGGNNSGGGGRQPGAVGSGGGSAGADDPGNDEDGRRKRGIYGVSHGAALIDLATGLVTVARVESDVVLVTQITLKNPNNNQEVAINVHIGFSLDTMLQRSLTKGPLVTIADFSTVLPNMPKEYNPLVGVGDPLMADRPKSNVPIPERVTTMAQDTMRKVQKAAVRIDVETAEGGGSGSGWFAEPGIVVTNCHVVDMASKSARKPQKITVVLDSGMDSERRFPGKLLAIDREDDLAVIKIDAPDLPEPMKIRPAESLVESATLTVLGFPWGTQNADLLLSGLGARDLKTTLKTRKTSVSGRFIATDETVKYITYEGGTDPGNSGSAVVDEDGSVRCIHVASLPDPRMPNKKMGTKMGIPAEYAQRLLQGYPLELETPYAYYDGSTPRQPISVQFGDPLRRVTRAAIDVWAGSSGKPRKHSDSLPTAKPGDGIRQTFELRMRPDESGLFMDAVGEFPLPARSEGQVFWLQPRFVNSSGKEQWGRAIAFSPDGPAVRRETVLLDHKLPKAGTERTIEMSSEALLHWQQLDEMHVEGAPLKATMIEKIGQPVRGASRVMFSYKDLIWDLPIQSGNARIDSEIRRLLKQFTDLIKGVVTVMTINKEGVLKLDRALTDYSRVPLGGLFFTKSFNDQLMQSLAAMSIPFPNKQVKYQDTWEHPTNLFIETKNKFEASLFNMKFKYLGVRDRGGRQEAVVEITGSLAQDDKTKSIDEKELKTGNPADAASKEPPEKPEPKTQPPTKKKARGLYGVAKGHAYIDVNGGYVAEVKMFIDLDVEMMVKDPDTKIDLPVPAGGTMELSFKRLTNLGSR